MLIDTSAWLIMFDKNNPQNKRTVDLYLSGNIRITHNYVISELISLAMARRHHLSRILDYVIDILNDSKIEVLWIDETYTWKALNLLVERWDKKWSLCDAVSFVVMEEFNITEALTTDHHFEQAGFIKLLDS